MIHRGIIDALRVTAAHFSVVVTPFVPRGFALNSVAHNVTELIGRTPMVYLNKVVPVGKPYGRVAAKLESFNPACSVKDRLGYLILEAEKSGEIQPGKTTLIEATSGNTGIGFAMVAASRGYRCKLVMPESFSVERRAILRAFGAEIILTPAAKGMTGAVNYARYLLSLDPRARILAQFDNPRNPEVHFKTTGPEIWDATDGHIDYLVCGVGTGGTITGAGRFLRQKKPGIRIVAVEPTESAVMSGNPPSPHKIQGIGAGFVPKVMDLRPVNEIIKVDAPTAVKTARRLAKEEGILCGISSGAAAAAACQIAQRPEAAGKLIVTLFPDFGERYLSTILFAEEREEVGRMPTIDIPQPAAPASAEKKNN